MCILYYILKSMEIKERNTKTFNLMEKSLLKVFSIKLSGNKLVIFHSIVFSILMALMLYIVLEPVVHTINASIGNGSEIVEDEQTM